MGAAAGSGGGAKESPLLRKLQAVSKTASAVGSGAVKESPLGRRTVTRGLDGIVEERDPKDPHNVGAAAPHGAGATGSMRRRLAMMNVDDAITEQEEEEQRLRKKELEAQKARIVAQMAPVREDGDPDDQDDQERDADMDQDEEDDEGMLPPPPPQQKFSVTGTGSLKGGKESLRLKERSGDLRADRENIAPAPSSVAPPVQRYASGSLRSGHHRNMGLGGVDKENMGLGGGSFLLFLSFTFVFVFLCLLVAVWWW